MKDLQELIKDVSELRAEVEWIKSELTRIHRDRPHPQSLNPYDLNRNKLKPIKRIRR